MGFTGLVSVSKNLNVTPDLAFFSLLLNKEIPTLSIIVIVLGISLTISSIDTLINAISSLIIVDGKKILSSNKDYLKLSRNIIIGLSFIALYVASKGFSILYLFLLADLFCCAAVLSIFYSFYSKSFPVSYFPEFVTQSLLFLSFIAATLLPVLTWKVK